MLLFISFFVISLSLWLPTVRALVVGLLDPCHITLPALIVVVVDSRVSGEVSSLTMDLGPNKSP